MKFYSKATFSYVMCCNKLLSFTRVQNSSRQAISLHG